MTAVIGLMLAVLLTSYTGARWAIQENATVNLRRSVTLYEHALEEQRIELARMAATIRDDAQVGEYAFATIRIGAGEQTLNNLLERRFARLPADAILLLWDGGRILQGYAAEQLAAGMPAWSDSPVSRTFYIDRDDALYLVADVPLIYEQEIIARIVVATDLASSWLKHQNLDTQAKLFFERDGKVLGSSDPRFVNLPFEPGMKKLRVGDAQYTLAAIRLPAEESGMTRLWLAQSDTAMLETLDRYNRIMLWLAVIVFSIMIPVALVAVNRFSRPVQKLISVAQKMADGQLPDLRRSRGYTEIDRLLNHFIDLIDALRRKQDEVEHAHQKLLHSSITDELTGLYNRRHLHDVFPKMLAQADREGLCIAAILIDIDFFKRINDSFGHQAGDACLRVFSETLTHIVRASDFVFRMGGEEFLVLATGHCGQDAALLAEKIRLATENCVVTVDGEPIRFTVSIGVSSYASGADMKGGLSEFITRADRALYEAKQSGRNCIRVYAGDEARGAGGMPQVQESRRQGPR